MFSLRAAVFSLAFVVGTSAAKNSLRGDERMLQLPPVVAQEVGIIAAGIPSLDAELIKFETPQSIRFTNYYGAIWWNCVATYSADFKDSLTKVLPSVVVTDPSLYNSANRGACVAQATASYNDLAIPNLGYIDAMAQIGITVEPQLDSAVAACSDALCLQTLAAANGFNPTIMGHIVAKVAHDFALADGWNEDGSEDCEANCRPYKDTTGYVPVKLPSGNGNANGKADRWQPLLEDNGKGFFFFQQHVTPHIGERATFRYLPESARTTKVAPDPNYSNFLDSEADAVIARMALLDDQKKIQIEQFDNKLIVVGALINSFVGKVLTDNYVDTELGQPGLILSFERFVHYIQALTAADHDATVIAWKEKINYDLVRPTTIIKKRGATQITTWALGGVQTFPAQDFEAYIRVMPHSEYVSGSACLFEVQKEFIDLYLTGIGLDPTSFPIAFPVVPTGASVVEPGTVPSADIQLTFPDVGTMAQVGSESRLDGGMHFGASVPGAQALCTGIADSAVIGSSGLI